MIISKACEQNDELPLSLHPGGIALTLDAARKAGICLGDRLLDIGCGTGASLAALKDELGIIPYGIDVSPKAAGLARSMSGEIVCGDAAALPWPDKYFDAVMMECVLTLLDDPAAALNEAARVLKPGGKLLISTLADTGNADSLIQLADNIGLSCILSEDRKNDLTDYMIDTIMRYDSLSERIKQEQEKTGASVFNCDTGSDYKTITYYLYIFER